MDMQIDILTLFPESVDAMLNVSILGRAQERGYIAIRTHQIRAYTTNKQMQVDDYPYGGGRGAVMQADPLFRCWEHVVNTYGPGRTIFMSPCGRTFTQSVAKELKAENLTKAHIVIAAGLPLTWTSGQKADFKEYLIKNAEVEFTYKKADYHLYIDDVRIYPQGYAAIVGFATTLKGVNLIADIGNGTMNTLYMINGKPQQGKMFTEKFGTYQCTLAVREAFMQKTQREINDAIINEVLITGTANIAPANLKIIKIVAAEYVRDIFRRLREHGYDENTMTLYVTGGGGCLVKNFYKFNADRVKFVEDICAAAKGYEYLAEVQIKSEAKV